VKPAVRKNVTLSLPEPVLRRFRVFAASRNQSMTAVMTEAIREMMDRDSDWDRAKRRLLHRIEHAPDRGLGDSIPWKREELYER
jgi:hypothetical protein